MTLEATLRTEDFGSAGTRRLIRAGKLAGEIYGKDGNVHIVLDAHAFELALRKIAVGMKVEVAVDGKKYNCIFKELQENIMTGVLIHVDFQAV